MLETMIDNALRLHKPQERLDALVALSSKFDASKLLLALCMRIIATQELPKKKR
ncbi:hypothetical protein LMIY3S_03667 [Labrys miyagiensis]